MNHFHLQISPLSAAEELKANDLNVAATIHFFSPLNILSLANLPRFYSYLCTSQNPQKSSQIFPTIKSHQYQIPWHPVWWMLNVKISPVHRHVSTRFLALSHSLVYQQRLRLSCQHIQVQTTTTKELPYVVCVYLTLHWQMHAVMSIWRIYLFSYLSETCVELTETRQPLYWPWRTPVPGFHCP